MGVNGNNDLANYMYYVGGGPSRSAVTLRLWIRRTGDSGAFTTAVAIDALGSGLRGISAGTWSNGDNLKASQSAGGEVDTGYSLTDGNYHCGHITFDNATTTFTVYVDGAQVYQDTASAQCAAAFSSVVLFQEFLVSYPALLCDIAAVAIWSGRVLDATEVADDLDALFPADATSLWAYWGLSTASDTNDTSGNGRHLTKSGTFNTVDDPPLGPPPPEATPRTTGRGSCQTDSARDSLITSVTTGRGSSSASCARASEGAAITTGRGYSGMSSYPVGDPRATGRGSCSAAMTHKVNGSARVTGRGSAEAETEKIIAAQPRSAGRGSSTASGTHERYLRAITTGRGGPTVAGTFESNIATTTGRGSISVSHTTQRVASGTTVGRGSCSASCPKGSPAAPLVTGRGNPTTTSKHASNAAPRVTGRGSVRATVAKGQNGAPLVTGRGSTSILGRHGGVARALATGRGSTSAIVARAGVTSPRISGRGSCAAAMAKAEPLSARTTGRGSSSVAHTTQRISTARVSGRGGSVAACLRASIGAPRVTGRGTSQTSGARNRDAVVITTGRGSLRAYVTQVPVVVGAHELALAAIVAAFRSHDCAYAAECDLGKWTSTTLPRVYGNLRGYIASRHRGRLPFVEIAKATEEYVQRSSDLGMHPTQWVVMVHVGGINVRAAEQRARAIMACGLAALRLGDLTWLGDADAARLTKDPLGYVLTCGLGIRNTYDPADHDVVAQGDA